MWIFFNDAFLSVVADSADPKGNRLLVRARAVGQIEPVFPTAEVFQVPGSDYAYRAWVPRQTVAENLAARAKAMDYPNFKNSIKDPGYHDAAMEVWSVMNLYQRRSPDPDPRQ
jgi:hypothetical protein